MGEGTSSGGKFGLAQIAITGAVIITAIYFIAGAPFLYGIYRFIFSLEPPLSYIFWGFSVLVVFAAIIRR